MLQRKDRERLSVLVSCRWGGFRARPRERACVNGFRTRRSPCRRRRRSSAPLESKLRGSCQGPSRRQASCSSATHSPLAQYGPALISFGFSHFFILGLLMLRTTDRQNVRTWLLRRSGATIATCLFTSYYSTGCQVLVRLVRETLAPPSTLFPPLPSHFPLLVTPYSLLIASLPL